MKKTASNKPTAPKPAVAPEFPHPMAVHEAATTAPVPTPRRTELPAAYGKTRLTLLEIDPRRLYAYWEITAKDREAAPTDGVWVLRFYDVTYIQFDGTNAHSTFDVPVDIGAGNWYIELWSGEKTYCAEIGSRAASGKFVPVARSNFVQIPREEPSPKYEPKQAQVEPVAGKLVPPPPPPPPKVAEPKPVAELPTPTDTVEVIKVKLRQHYEELAVEGGKVTVPKNEPPPAATPAPATATPPATPPVPLPVPTTPKTETVSSFALGSGGFGLPEAKPAIDLKMNAEVILSGRAQPGQTLQLNGRWVTVNPDGTFTVRLALPLAGN